MRASPRPTSILGSAPRRARPAASTSRAGGRTLIFGAVAVLVLVSGCSFPAATSGDVSQGQLLLDMADALDGLRSQNADLQAQIDSLRVDVARQDSLLTRVATLNGITTP